MRAGDKDERGYTYYDNLSATPPWYAVRMECDACKLFWISCWDNVQCPKCGGGELPTFKDGIFSWPGDRPMTTTSNT